MNSEPTLAGSLKSRRRGRMTILAIVQCVNLVAVLGIPFAWSASQRQPFDETAPNVTVADPASVPTTPTDTASVERIPTECPPPPSYLDPTSPSISQAQTQYDWTLESYPFEEMDSIYYPGQSQAESPPLVASHEPETTPGDHPRELVGVKESVEVSVADAPLVAKSTEVDEQPIESHEPDAAELVVDTAEPEVAPGPPTPAIPEREFKAPQKPGKIINPLSNRLTITFMVNRRSVTLAAGETFELSGTDSWVVAFHRGGKFGNQVAYVYGGDHEFKVDREGWRIVPTNE